LNLPFGEWTWRAGGTRHGQSATGLCRPRVGIRTKVGCWNADVESQGRIGVLRINLAFGLECECQGSRLELEARGEQGFQIFEFAFGEQSCLDGERVTNRTIWKSNAGWNLELRDRNSKLGVEYRNAIVETRSRMKTSLLVQDGATGEWTW
jgi:hypothetical protein